MKSTNNLYKNFFINPPPPHGRFGAIRKHDCHTGVDLYCPVGTEIEALEDGVVVAVENFTGPNVGSPWWHDTQAVMVEGNCGVILYGEIDSAVVVGQKIKAGQIVGKVLQVLKEDKGKPLAMLHLEWYTPGITASVWWKLNEPQPRNLLNIEALLKEFYVGLVEIRDE